MTDNRIDGSLKPRPTVVGIELHSCRERGRWVGIADSTVYADTIHQLWMEGYHASFVPLEDGGMQVRVREGLDNDTRNPA